MQQLVSTWASGPAKAENRPRRAFRDLFAPHWDVAVADDDKRRVRVTRLGSNRFRVVTERVLTESELQAEGIPVPGEDVPWAPEQRGPPPEKLRAAEGTPIHTQARFALEYWKKNVGGHDSRLSSLLIGAVRDFGLPRVLSALDEVGATKTNEPRYLRFRKVLRRMRGGTL